MLVLYKKLRVPEALQWAESDSAKVAEQKRVLKHRFKSLYIKIISSASMREVADILSKSMKDNLFVNIFESTDGYYSFDNPSSKSYISQIHALGALTVNSDVFTYTAPSLSPVFTNFLYSESRAPTRLQHVTPEKTYSSETQYGFVTAFVHTNVSSRLHEIAHTLPELTSVTRITMDEEVMCYTRHTGNDPNPRQTGDVLNKTTSLHHQKSAPPFHTIKFSTDGNDMADYHATMYRTSSENLPRHLLRTLQSYDIIEICDNDFSAQKRNKHRVFKTFIRILKTLHAKK